MTRNYPRKRTHHLADRKEASRLEMRLEAQGLRFQTFHEPWDFQPYRVTVTLTRRAP